ncbi:hypothetical protein [Streptomyces sp. NBC_00932]|uniref:hypothetical protein n=1 Tax=Streptomyces sp. NBC_00932 TaxID=2903690 RepID=UPI0038656CD9|nr:hypothetical protein OG221_27535 [Streptomyces sp. NBC_00932]
MTLLRPETVILSNSLCDLASAPPEVRQQIGTGLVRALGLSDRDFEDTVAAGYVESVDDWAARIGGAR